MSGDSVLDDLQARGLVHDHTDEAELRSLLAEGPVTLYHGIDPTADSLHVGNLIGVLVLRRFQQGGHRPLALVGGATGMVGDPSGRSDERNLLDTETLAANLAGIKAQLEGLLDFEGDNAALMVNNHDWTRDVTLLDFLRDVGKHVTVNAMLAKESVKARVDSESGITYTEFSYMLLQAFDFWWQYETYGCRLQVGGSDQWGNITAGIDLTRRRSGATVHGLTWPLMTRTDGAKFGKTAAGTVWLDPAKTLPYEFHQYFMNVDDADVEKLLLQLTMIDVAEVAAIVSEHGGSPEKRYGQRRLADGVTELVHGADEVRRANLAAGALFGGEELTGDSLDALRGIIPVTVRSSAILDGEESAVDVLVATEVCSSRGDARRVIDQGGVRLNGERIASAGDGVTVIDDRFVLVQRGKKQRHLLVIEG